MAVRRAEPRPAARFAGRGPTLAGGGGNNASLLYYLDSGNSRILGAGLSTTGAFTALTTFTPPTLPSGAGNDMVIVNKKFLYLPQNDSLTIQAFTIDHTSGALTTISGSPFATAGADSITSDPAGRFLFVGNQTTGSVSVFQINATTGALVAAPVRHFLPSIWISPKFWRSMVAARFSTSDRDRHSCRFMPSRLTRTTARFPRLREVRSG